MPENAAIVIDNALYIDKILHSNSCKSKIVDWLAAKTIIDSLNTLKVELLELIKLKLSCLKLINLINYFKSMAFKNFASLPAIVTLKQLSIFGQT